MTTPRNPGARAARELLADDSLPTAVIAGNDRCVIGLLGTFSRLGINVPGDVSIVGYTVNPRACPTSTSPRSGRTYTAWVTSPSPPSQNVSTRGGPRVATSSWIPH